MDEATEYLKDLDTEAWESRDYGVDDHAFEHHINANESRDYYEGLAETFPDGNVIADKLLGEGWDKLDNEYAQDTKNSVNLYNTNQHSMFMKNMFTNIRSTRDHMHKTKNSLTAVPVVEEYEPIEEQQSEESTDLRMIALKTQSHIAEANEIMSRVEALNSLHGLEPSHEDLDILQEMGVATEEEQGYMTPSEAGDPIIRPATPVHEGPTTTINSFEPIEEKAFTYTSIGTQADDFVQPQLTYASASHHVPVVQNPIFVAGYEHDEKLDEGGLVRIERRIESIENHIKVRTRRPGLAKTFYVGKRREVNIPEPSMKDRQRLFGMVAHGERPLATKHAASRKALGDFVVVERSGTRFHIEVQPNMPNQSVNRLINLLQVHSKKMGDAILNQYINGTEQTYGPIKNLSKAKLRKIIRKIHQKATFIVVSPSGAGLQPFDSSNVGALGSDFWTHRSLADILSRR
jgi:hypothetical protein